MPLEGEEYVSYDPASMSPTSSGPPVELSSGVVEPTGTGGDTAGSKIPEFDSRYREEFQGLMYLGALTKKFEWLGHEFIIRTLTTDEVLNVGLITKEYEGSLGINKAYTTAIVSACIVSIDEKELPLPYMEEKGPSILQNRFDYVKGKWYPYTVDYVYNMFLELEDMVQKVFDAMGEARGQTI